MLRKLCLVLMLLSFASPVFGQLNLSYTSFQPGQTISSTQFTANFTAISSNALNRTGGIMTGSLQVQNITVATTNLYDLGATGARFKDLWLAGNATVGGTLNVTGVSTLASATITTLTCTGCVGTTQLADSGVSATSYGSASSVATFTVDIDGRITTAANATIEVASANITNDSIVNADINSAAGIVDTKLATISTAGKVSNSATTATSANTASAIVARDGSGNFTAGTISAANFKASTGYQRIDGTGTALILGNGTNTSYADTFSFLSSASLTQATLSSTGFSQSSTIGQAVLRNNSGVQEVHIRPGSGNKGYLTFTEDTIADRWAIGIDNGNSNLYFRAGANAATAVATLSSAGNLTLNGSLAIGSSFSSTSFCITSTDVCMNDISGDIELTTAEGRTVFFASTVATIFQGVTVGDPTGNLAVKINPTSSFTANNNNTLALGSAGSRWTTVFSVNADNISSDVRLKENIIDLPHGLETLKTVKVYQYNMIGSEGIHYGVIAQQLKTTDLAHVVAGSEEEGYGVAYTELIPVLIKSIQELEARVAELENER